ncbi:MAG TPA: pyrroloquinoline quinone-dependent dehydrogenase [Nevskiaceae bacterium]|nr:pyrroloquinoline quinone-dependent dehydrogenase [Nevskiaceae bacterium]
MKTRRIAARGRLLIASLALLAPASTFGDAQWPAVGGTDAGQRWSALDQVRKENVARLQQAWVYHHGDFTKGVDGVGASAFQATPIEVDGTLYFCTPFNRVVALDAATGRERWTFDPKVDRTGVYTPVCRGVAYWKDAAAQAGAPCAERIFEGTLDARLIALDARTGRACADFGERGSINLLTGLGRVRKAEYYPTSPPLAIADRVVIGAFVKDGQRIDAPSGALRAFDARSGVLSWVWDPVPPGTKAVTADDVRHGGTLTPGTPNVWALMSADVARGLIYAPTGNPAPDHYGGVERGGRDHYGSSVVALDAASGAVRWHFQTVHRDVWDYDLAAQPVLYEHKQKDGSTLPALIVATKLGFVFLLDRVTGAPIFPVEERAVPASTIDTIRTAPTQPFPTRPAPLHALTLTPDDVWGLSFWDKGRCEGIVAALDTRGVFTPPSLTDTLEYPGLGGGINWGSVSVDPRRNRMVVNLQVAPFVLRLVPRAEHKDATNGTDLVGFQPQEGTPYVAVRAPLLSPMMTPCVKPPWGRLVAIDLDSGEKAWDRPLGTLKGLAPLVGGSLDWGTPNSGGSLTTAGGLTFIAATMDKVLRAFDTDTGAELWRFDLPFGAHAAPMTYRAGADGRQFLVIGAGGHGPLGTEPGDAIVAFTLKAP